MKNDKVSKAKRLIARMDKSEIREIGRYMNERYRLLEKRETWRRQTEQYRAYWEKISALSPGSKVAVNAYGDRQWPRGTELQIDRFENEGHRRRVWLKTAEGKSYFCTPSSLYSFDIQPAAEIDLTKMADHFRLLA